jgi:hypothetical protein
MKSNGIIAHGAVGFNPDPPPQPPVGQAFRPEAEKKSGWKV